MPMRYRDLIPGVVMAFEGDLSNLAVGDIFQTLGMNRQSGTLVVNHKGVERRFYFSEDGVSLLTSRNARERSTYLNAT